MTPFSLALTGSAAVIVLETCMWMFFRRKIRGIHFPRAADASQWKFFSLHRIRCCALTHAAFLIGSLFAFTALAQ